jgi:hypothetical protein
MTGVVKKDDPPEPEEPDGLVVEVEVVVVEVVELAEVVVVVVELEVERKFAVMELVALTTMVVARDVVATGALLKAVMPLEGFQESKLYPA